MNGKLRWFTVLLDTFKYHFYKYRGERLPWNKLLMAKKKPLVFVVGSTGTGKSDLGIAIAKRYRGEVISADSMQIYKGLDIATNKVDFAEMDGVSHHMMSFLEPTVSSYSVHDFQRQAISKIEEIWSRGNVPIVVGGTVYYVESLLFKHTLIPTSTEDSKDDFIQLSDNELYDLLKRIDPVSAMQVHKHNRFRVARALQIYFATGRKKSDFIRDQQRQLAISNFTERLRYPNALIYFLDARGEVLMDRLNERVAKMVQKGLRKEVEDFHDKYGDSLTTHGVSQSIAVKEFSDYLKLTPAERQSPHGDDLFQQGCEMLKLHTRQYSKRQLNWVKQHLLNGRQPTQASTVIYLDTSSDFKTTVVPLALEKLEAFFGAVGGGTFCATKEYYDDEVFKYRKLANQIHHCDICDIDIQGTNSWLMHLKGKKHRGMLARRKKQEDSLNSLVAANPTSMPSDLVDIEK